MRLINRREAIGAVVSAAALRGAPAQDSRQATGLKIGEITPASAVIWTRRTASASRLADGLLRKGHAPNARPPTPEENVDRFEGACPGAAGSVRISLEPKSAKGKRQTVGWVELVADTDFTHQFRLEGLQPATEYCLAVETRSATNRKADAQVTGEFRTAPRESDRATVKLALSSCQIYCRQDRPGGFAIYEALEQRRPDFLLSCGDNVYYDSEDPVANSPAVARYHWQRMYSLPNLHSCLRVVPGYWQKDDHDVYTDDGWPGLDNPKMLPFTFRQGQRIFREQVPSPPLDQPLYRRFRWGTDLEIFLPDSRDYRSPNNSPDGPAKTIWGEEQRRWLQNALTTSTARWKLLINPNPMVGPDHARKNDNHSNPAFATEGREFKRWLKDHAEGVVLMNGDRHWQYHSVDPEFQVHEFGCGPASDEHAIAPSRGENPQYHRFLRVKGGFIAVTVNPAASDEAMVVEHCDVSGSVVYRRVFPRG